MSTAQDLELQSIKQVLRESADRRKNTGMYMLVPLEKFDKEDLIEIVMQSMDINESMRKSHSQSMAFLREIREIRRP